MAATREQYINGLSKSQRSRLKKDLSKQGTFSSGPDKIQQFMSKDISGPEQVERLGKYITGEKVTTENR